MKPIGIWFHLFWLTPESIAREEAEQQERFMNGLRDEFREADEEREKEKKRIERPDDLTQKLRSRGLIKLKENSSPFPAS